jgi:hypothetical protein
MKKRLMQGVEAYITFAATLRRRWVMQLRNVKVSNEKYNCLDIVPTKIVYIARF